MASTIGLPSHFGRLLATVDVPDLCWKRPLLLAVTGAKAAEVADHLAAVHPLAHLRVTSNVPEPAAVRVAMALLRQQKSVLMAGVLPTEKLSRLARQNRGGFQAVYALGGGEPLPRRVVGKRPFRQAHGNPFVCHPQDGDLRHMLLPLHKELRQRLGNEAWWANRYDRLLY